MDTVLIILGVLGLGAMVIAVYVFTVAARRNVSNNDHHRRRGMWATPSATSPYIEIERSKTDRRKQAEVHSFPITVNGLLIQSDRRQLPERRIAA